MKNRLKIMARTSIIQEHVICIKQRNILLLILDGIFRPCKRVTIKKGVGEYTAAAIASFSYNEAVPVVDGNVLEYYPLFDIETDIAWLQPKKEFAALC
jgi:hypothetical protein